MEQGYWAKFSTQRVARRRALATSGGSALGAMLLAACGSDGGGSSDTSDKSSLVMRPEDSFKQAKRGGILKDLNIQEPPSLEFGTP